MSQSGDHDEGRSRVDEDGSAADATDDAVMELLADHVPLTLLVDLVDAPPSEQVLVEEGLPEEPWWEPDAGGEPRRG